MIGRAQQLSYTEAAFHSRCDQAQASAQAEANRVKHPLIARMDEIAAGCYDRDENGANRLYRGFVGGEAMMAQVVAKGGDLVICFFAAGRDHSRRLLVTADAEYWLEVDGKAVKHFGKYASASITIIARRLFEQGQEGAVN